MPKFGKGLISFLDSIFMPDGTTKQTKRNNLNNYEEIAEATCLDTLKKGTYAVLIGWNFDKILELPKIIDKYLL